MVMYLTKKGAKEIARRLVNEGEVEKMVTLILAAPKLLVAAKAALSTLISYTQRTGRALAVNKLRAAIAEAEGSEP